MWNSENQSGGMSSQVIGVLPTPMAHGLRLTAYVEPGRYPMAYGQRSTGPWPVAYVYIARHADYLPTTHGRHSCCCLCLCAHVPMCLCTAAPVIRYPQSLRTSVRAVNFAGYCRIVLAGRHSRQADEEGWVSTAPDKCVPACADTASAVWINGAVHFILCRLLRYASM